MQKRSCRSGRLRQLLHDQTGATATTAAVDRSPSAAPCTPVRHVGILTGCPPRGNPTVPVDLLVHLRRARDLADRCYAEPLDLDALAAAAGLSKYHFLRSFAAEYGRTPAQYLCHRRIERAQDLLRATNLTVTEICHLVGFTNLGSFSSRFRELVGVARSAYQARYARTGATTEKHRPTARP